MYGFNHITDITNMLSWGIFMVVTFMVIIGVAFVILWDRIKDGIKANRSKKVEGSKQEELEKKDKKESINWANVIYRFRLVFAFIGLIGFFGLVIYGFADLWRANDEYNSDLEDKISENQQNEKEMSAYMSDIGLVNTDKTILISNDSSISEYSVKYDIHTKLVYLSGYKGDIMPYMKDATTQYIWNTEKNAIE